MSDRSKFISVLDKLQLHISVLILSAIVLSQFHPATKPFSDLFLTVKGQISPDKDEYGCDKDDKWIVAVGIIGIIFTRVFFMEYIFGPMARLLLKNKSKGAVLRFCEQGWSFVYYSTSFLFGFHLLYNSIYFNNLETLFKGYPHTMSKELKVYYLFQLANWFSQVFIIHVEKRRKDHYQMLTHHIITIALVHLSYVKHFTRIGNVISTLMDFVDIWLALAKLLRYCGFSNACDFTFLIFFFSWIALRHGFYNYLIYFSYHEVFKLVDEDLCQNNTSSTCITVGFCYTVIGLLSSLEVIMCLWMYLILKVLYKILTGANAEDIRSSDDEDEENDATVSGDQNEKSKLNSIAENEKDVSGSDDEESEEIEVDSEKVQLLDKSVDTN